MSIDKCVAPVHADEYYHEGKEYIYCFVQFCFIPIPISEYIKTKIHVKDMSVLKVERYLTIAQKIIEAQLNLKYLELICIKFIY